MLSPTLQGGLCMRSQFCEQQVLSGLQQIFQVLHVLQVQDGWCGILVGFEQAKMFFSHLIVVVQEGDPNKISYLNCHLLHENRVVPLRSLSCMSTSKVGSNP